MHVVALIDRDRIRDFLRTDRFFADYALGDLDPAHFPFTTWFGAKDDGRLCAIAMLYNDLTPPIFFATGEARGIEAILDRVVRVPEIGISIRDEHLPIVERFYRVDPVPMLKMALESTSWRAQAKQSVDLNDEIASSHPSTTRQKEAAPLTPCPQSGGAPGGMLLTMTRLDVSHMPLLEELYAHGGGDAFRQRSLELGVFYGVFDSARLVSVAGTHIVSDNERVAALGNVMTHPDYRGRGLATMATRAVCEELLDRGIEMIGLSVSRSNAAAIHVYEKIGFKRHVPFYEGTASRIEIKDRKDQA